MRISIDAPLQGGVHPPHDASSWKVVCAVLEAIEPGASKHCLKRTSGLDFEAWEHHRLGVAFLIEESPES